MKSLHRVVRWQTGQSFTDTTSGFRAFDAPVVAMLARDYPVEYLADTVEVLLMVLRAGYKVVEVPVAMRTRAGGQPSARHLQLAYNYLRLMIGILASASRRAMPPPAAKPETTRDTTVSTRAHILLIVAAGISVGYIFWLLRQHQLRSKYALLWLGIGIVLVPLAVFPGVLNTVADWLGVAYPPAAFLFLAVGFLFFVVVHFSWELSRLERRVRTLAEEIALLRAEGGAGASVSADEHPEG